MKACKQRLWGRGLRGDAEGGNKPLLVETDNHFIPDEDDRHTHLARLLYHLLTFLEILRDTKPELVAGAAD